MNVFRSTGASRALLLSLLASTTFAASACSRARHEKGGSADRIGAQRAAIVGGTTDGNVPEADVVVALAHPSAPRKAVCSGVRISATTVLTAKECVADRAASLRPVVLVGPNVAQATPYRAAKDAAYMGDAATLNDPSAPVLGEVALVSLPATRELYDRPAVLVKPDFVEPVKDEVPVAPGEAPRYRFAGLTVAGYGSADATRPAVPSDVRLRHAFDTLTLIDHWPFSPDQGFYTRSAAVPAGQLAAADVGGALFATVNGSRHQLFGVAVAAGVNDGRFACPPSGAACDVWVDVSRDTAKGWILGKVQIPKTDKNVRWFERHPKNELRPDGVTDWWYGEVDYLGPCDAAKDADCDHWLDFDPEALARGQKIPRDNCLAANDQADADDDGVGDACERSPYDWNGDGRPDVAWYNPETGVVHVDYLEGATVKGGANLETKHRAMDGWELAAIADFDRNAVPDLFWHDKVSGDVTVETFAGTKLEGTTVLVQKRPGREGFDLRGVADFDGDSSQDLVWHNPRTGAVELWFLQGTTVRNVAPLSEKAPALQGWSVVTAAKTEDGARIFVQNRRTHAVESWTVRGTEVLSRVQVTDGRVTPAIPYVDMGTDLRTVYEVADFDGDSRADLLSWGRAGNAVISVLDGNVVRSQQNLSTTPADAAFRLRWEAAVAVDANRDGFEDILVYLGLAKRASFTTLDGTKQLANLPAVETIDAAADGRQIETVGDFDRDGNPDIVVRDWSSGAITVDLQRGNTITGRVQLTQPLPGASMWDIGGSADMDRDGYADLLLHNPRTGVAAWWSMHGSAEPRGVDLEIGSPHVSAAGWTLAGGGDFDRDGYADLLWHNRIDGALEVQTHRGEKLVESRVLKVRYPVESGTFVEAIGDFDRDGAADILLRKPSTGATFYLAGATLFEEAPQNKVLENVLLLGEAGRDIGAPLRIANDVDHDGFQDLIWEPRGTWPGDCGYGVQYWRDGAPHMDQCFYGLLPSAGHADFNRDGFPDSIVVSDHRYAVQPGSGRTSTVRGALIPLPIPELEEVVVVPDPPCSQGAICFENDYIRYVVQGAGDFDRDGIPDLLVVDSLDSVAPKLVAFFLHRDRTVREKVVLNLARPIANRSRDSGIFVQDFDLDGALDFGENAASPFAYQYVFRGTNIEPYDGTPQLLAYAQAFAGYVFAHSMCGPSDQMVAQPSESTPMGLYCGSYAPAWAWPKRLDVTLPSFWFRPPPIN